MSVPSCLNCRLSLDIDYPGRVSGDLGVKTTIRFQDFCAKLRELKDPKHLCAQSMWSLLGCQVCFFELQVHQGLWLLGLNQACFL